jgi:hypothetical protein
MKTKFQTGLPQKGAMRRSCHQSSAELYSAVSRICNPLAVVKPGGPAKSDPLPNAIRRYGRLQICATPQRGGSKKYTPGNNIFMDSAPKDTTQKKPLCFLRLFAALF